MVVKEHLFKIIEESTLDYGSDKQVWLMLIKINGEFGIELNDRYSLLGRKIAKHRREAEVMFTQIQTKLSNLSYKAVIDVLRLGFSYPTVRELMFVINTRYTTYDFNTLCKLKSIYGYSTFPRLEDLIWEDKNLGYKIEVYFPGNKEPIGRFEGLSANEDTRFKFFLNESPNA